MDTRFQPIAQKIPKYRQAAYMAIKESLLSGQIRMDEPLIEEQIAAALQISRTPVREALAILEHEGLISPRGGRGLSIRKLTGEEFDQLMTANELIEPGIGRRAAHLATEEQLYEMEKALQREKFEISNGHFARFCGCGRVFHEWIGIASENTPATAFTARNDELITLFLLRAGYSLPTEAMLSIARQHEAIWNALVRRDPDEAARLLVYHAQRMRELFQPLGQMALKSEDSSRGDLDALG